MRKYLYLSLFFILLIIFLFAEIYLPQNAFNHEEQIFNIKRGQTLFQISDNLKKEKIIKNKFLFDFYILIRGKSKELKAGRYQLSSSMSIAEIAQKIISGDNFLIRVTIPEGFTIKQISDVIGKDLNAIKIKDIKEKFDFLKDVPDDASLEGFLFPDTYFLDSNMTSEEIVTIFLRNFDKKITPLLQKEIKKRNKNIFQIVIMASLLEKEVINTKECPDCKSLVSGILWKRLENNMPLQVDATISYITGKKTTKISREELQIDSPYNTYKYLGLPKAPICNPGLESILAAVYPKKSEYWYYLSSSNGKTIFSKNLKDHNIAKFKYLR